jgi:hypothetical protein
MIRPIDLQNSILQSIQSAPGVQRAEDGPRIAAQAAQAAFAAAVTVREESVAPSAEVVGNRVGAKPEKDREDGSRGGKRKPADSFEESADDAAGLAEEPAHLIDFTA